MSAFSNKYKIMGIVMVMSLFMFSCDLNEVNPSGTTANAIWSSPAGFVTLVNAAYSDQRQMYGKIDGPFLYEAGTDLWFNANKDGYAKELSKYENFTPATGNPNKKGWSVPWRAINLCNAGINRIDEAGYVDEIEKNKRLAELRFLRAFYYWHIVESYGGVMLRTEETKVPLLTAERSSVEDFYDLIIDDLTFAKDNLPLDHGNEYSRASKKSAMGFLARAYLSRAYYGDGPTYFGYARDEANEIIAQQGELGVELWDNYADIHKPENNANNKEALYIVSNSAANTNLNFDNNGNRLHRWWVTRYNEYPGLDLSLEYGETDARRFMPTLALLDFYDDMIDSRYQASFREVWIANSDFTWDAALVTQYGKDPSLIGTTVTAGQDTALVITKRSIENEEILPYIVFDRDSVYNTSTDNTIKVGQDYVQLIKFEEPNREFAAQIPGYNDVMVMRLAEVYLIAAEAEFQLNNPNEAADHINVLRTRAAIKAPVDQTAAMQVEPGDVNLDFILDERARELAGEHVRWFDLKRTGKLLERVNAYNPDVTEIRDYHVLRPIPQEEMDALLNRDEFGQNQGYQ
ncbi:MAG: RagB/SusD family nutrient uptake outer membrane protein [Cyclobacteriaceae bacterium]